MLDYQYLSNITDHYNNVFLFFLNRTSSLLSGEIWSDLVHAPLICLVCLIPSPCFVSHPKFCLYLMPIKFPCIVCNNPVKSNQSGIFCDYCKLWVHLKCTDLTYFDFYNLANNTDPWYCPSCISSIFPFNELDPTEFRNVFTDNINLLNSVNSDYQINTPELHLIEDPNNPVSRSQLSGVLSYPNVQIW